MPFASDPRNTPQTNNLAQNRFNWRGTFSRADITMQFNPNQIHSSTVKELLRFN